MPTTKTASRLNSRYERRSVKTVPKGESLTRQSEAKAADINYIVGKAVKTGFLPVVSRDHIPQVPTASSFHEAMNLITETKQKFEALPSDVRQTFDNDPGKLLDAINSEDEAVQQNLIDLGIKEAPLPEPDPLQVEVVSPEPAPADPPADPPAS